MTKDEILKYKVIKGSTKSKKEFDKALLNDTYKPMATFKNEYGELFVLYRFNVSGYMSNIIFITGDEFGWETGYCVNEDGLCYQEFLLNKEERATIIKIMKELNES